MFFLWSFRPVLAILFQWNESVLACTSPQNLSFPLDCFVLFLPFDETLNQFNWLFILVRSNTLCLCLHYKRSFVYVYKRSTPESSVLILFNSPPESVLHLRFNLLHDDCKIGPCNLLLKDLPVDHLFWSIPISLNQIPKIV